MQNTVTTNGNNSEHIFTLAITDTNEHDFPDTDADDSAGGDGWSVEGAAESAAKVVNTEDQDATVRLEATTEDDPTFAEAVEVVSGVTVTAGTAKLLVDADDAPADLYRVVVSYATAPTSGETKVVYTAR